jgi:hypothetical protein
MTAMVNFLSTAAAEIAARRPASPDPIMSTSCAIAVMSANYALPSFLPFRKATNSHIYLELLQLIVTKQKAINCCIHAAIILNMIHDILDGVVVQIERKGHS